LVGGFGGKVLNLLALFIRAETVFLAALSAMCEIDDGGETNEKCEVEDHFVET
jgi:hypothetical protein